MHVTELPPAAWPRLAGTELAAVWPVLTAETGRILAVTEGPDDDAPILGCWALMPIWHVEGLWIAPSQRASGAVARALLRTMARWITDADLPGVLTAALAPDVARYLTRLGARPLPGQAFLWPREEITRCLPR